MHNLMIIEFWVFVLGQVNESVASSCQIYPFKTEEEIFYLNIYPLQLRMIFHVQWNLVGTEIGRDDFATSFKI